MFDVQWNTGRLYAADGQIIRAIEQEDGSILFTDFSRMIAGKIETPRFRPTSEHGFKAHVMAAYDHNKYRMDVHAMGLQRKS